MPLPHFAFAAVAALCFCLQGRFHKSFEQRMGPVGPGLQFRMRLSGDKERMFFQFDHFHNPSIR